ncbi:MAG: alpha/beta hydrolase [Lachnospiraceae bacterium]|nr:alpha/beta hydrolase [Lachnospiraceae bacterium]
MQNDFKINHLKNNPTMEGLALLRSGIVYSEEDGEQQTLDLLLPWSVGIAGDTQKKHPLLVFVQGSGWTTPDRGLEIPQLSSYARAGYVVATVGHRDYTKGHQFPAYLNDVKCAIRFLRKNADFYGIDTERVALWGTSSGGNTALLIGLTAGDPRYETANYAGYSDAVSAVVSCFAPTDVRWFAEQNRDNPEFCSILSGMFGPDPETWTEQCHEMSPVCHTHPQALLPPFLLLHGDADMLVDFGQMKDMYRVLLDCGASVEAWQVDGAEHEGNFWSDEVHEVIRAFIDRHVMR